MVSIAGMVLILLLIAVLIALVTVSCSLLLVFTARVFKASSNYSFCAQHSLLTPYLLLFLACYLFARLFKLWVIKFQYEITVKALFIALLLAIIVYWRNRRDFLHKIEVLVAKTWLPASVMVVCCIVLVGWRVTTNNHSQTHVIERAGKQYPGSVKQRPNVILITFDALSSEDMSLYGYYLKTTPNIDEFGKQCYVFNNAIAAANWTRPSVASLLTGKYPDTHRLINNGGLGNLYQKPQESLPALLKESGYKTIALVANWNYAHPYATGIADSFDIKPFRYIAWYNMPALLQPGIRFNHYSLLISSTYRINTIAWLLEIYNEWVQIGSFKFKSVMPFYPPELVFNDAEHLILELSDKEPATPIFMWLHVLIPHDPYLPPKPFKGSFLTGADFSTYDQMIRYVGNYEKADQSTIDRLRLRYDENILYADSVFGNFVANLHRSGKLDNSIVIVSADHGESFNHGYQGHGGNSLFQQSVNIPLLIRVPFNCKPKNREVNVSQTDIAPSIMNLLGLDVPIWMEGESLFNLTEKQLSVNRQIFSMNIDGNCLNGAITHGCIAVIANDYKYIYNIDSKSVKMYSLKADPKEINNIAHAKPLIAKKLHNMIKSRLKLTNVNK
ncbi:sulfatase [Citrifermentans pelophilum]|nr:sulfatase [Geoanaerobacter pelophilus]